MSSSTPIESPNVFIETINGNIQISQGGGESTIGLLVERDGVYHGTLLSMEQAQKLAGELLRQFDGKGSSKK